jgi:hypothetical protein
MISSRYIKNDSETNPNHFLLFKFKSFKEQILSNCQIYKKEFYNIWSSIAGSLMLISRTSARGNSPFFLTLIPPVILLLSYIVEPANGVSLFIFSVLISTPRFMLSFFFVNFHQILLLLLLFSFQHNSIFQFIFIYHWDTIIHRSWSRRGEKLLSKVLK